MSAQIFGRLWADGVDSKCILGSNKVPCMQGALKLPYLSDNVSNKIRYYVKSRKLPVRIIFTPGNTLRQMFCSSRPFDKPSCVLGNPKKCQICPKITNV